MLRGPEQGPLCAVSSIPRLAPEFQRFPRNPWALYHNQMATYEIIDSSSDQLMPTKQKVLRPFSSCTTPSRAAYRENRNLLSKFENTSKKLTRSGNRLSDTYERDLARSNEIDSYAPRTGQLRIVRRRFHLDHGMALSSISLLEWPSAVTPICIVRITRASPFPSSR